MVTVKDARTAIEFYKKAFGAEELFSMPGPDGKGIMHAELRIGNSIVMMGEEQPDCPSKSAETLGGSPVSFYLYVYHADESFARALAAGAVSQMPVDEMFWGDRVGTVQDPFGYSWMLATHTRDLSPEEMQRGAQEFFAKMARK